MKKVINVLNCVLDFVIIPILFCTILFSCVFLIKESNNTVPTLFNYSFVRVLSESMEADGFEKGDIAVIKQSDTEEYAIGTIISFYYAVDAKNPEPDNGSKDQNAVSAAQKSGKKIYFHRIVDRQQDKDGVWWYTTQGSSNKLPDAHLIRHDFVVGKYVDSPSFFLNFIKFISTPKGIIFITFIPSAALFLALLYQMIISINYASFEKLLLRGEVSIFEDYCVENMIADNLDEKEKLNIFYTSPKNLRQKYYALLWHGDIMSGKKPTIYNAVAFEEIFLYKQLDFKTKIILWIKQKRQNLNEFVKRALKKDTNSYIMFKDESENNHGTAVPIELYSEIDDDDIPFLNRKKRKNNTIDLTLVEEIVDEGVSEDLELHQFDNQSLVDLSKKECRLQKKIHEEFIRKKAINIWDPNQEIDFKTQETLELLEDQEETDIHTGVITETSDCEESFSGFVSESNTNKNRKIRKKMEKEKEREKPFAVFEALEDGDDSPSIFYEEDK